MEQEKQYKVIGQGDNYKLLEWLYKNIPIVFRVWNSGKVEIKLDDNFALANGYLTLKSMLAACIHKRGAANMGIYKTDWVRVGEDGNFYLQGVVKVNALFSFPFGRGNEESIN